ncbi:MAG TPA: PEP-CTERM sorting domain-containing protein [Vicinamibacterales bacterium]
MAVLTLLGATTARASTIPLTLPAFGIGTSLSTFDGLASGTEVNGLTADGITYQYSLDNGMVTVGSGPGITSNVTDPSAVSFGDPTGVLTLMLPSLVDMFGYGYALLALTPVVNATSISLFNGAVPVGTMSYGGAPDPLFTGGFAGIQSTLPFNRVQLTFNGAEAEAFALDNVRTGVADAAPVPEPASLMLLGTGLLMAARVRARRSGR